ncbi:16S rRNA processing protein RimM [Thioclava sp. SK-1]|uniref:ribosome maturation factor RimM n=1 Tax=Thioclava sp. SK-1 TaxID=1889770 RepID=UPI000825D484|nr:ribosome maturation factor RimM [Thioclava sp. SK-1]OCX66969.1 16S rRNA processing protein RimM [Thioclava sp. SK-1]
MSKSERVCVGAIAGAFGVSGEVRVKSFCADPESIAEYRPLYSEDGTREFTLAQLRAIKGGLGVRLSDVDTKEQADALKGVTLWVDRDKLASLPDDEFYHADLIGLDVVDVGGASLGKLHAVQNYGAGDILEIHAAWQSTSLMLPFTREVVPTVDLTAGRIVVDPPEGV